jgi:signal transduction histidine kinase
VENLLHFSRGERSGDRLALQCVEVTPFVRDVVAGFTPIAAAHGATIACAVGAGHAVRADPDALRQMLLNLLDNTVKYGPHGQTITVGSGAAGGMITIHVDDEGPGVPERERTRIFERFARVEGDGPSVAGTGIGLAVVADLSRRQGGRAWVERAPGGGARFIIALPVAMGDTSA